MNERRVTSSGSFSILVVCLGNLCRSPFPWLQRTRAPCRSSWATAASSSDPRDGAYVGAELGRQVDVWRKSLRLSVEAQHYCALSANHLPP